MMDRRALPATLLLLGLLTLVACDPTQDIPADVNYESIENEDDFYQWEKTAGTPDTPYRETPTVQDDEPDYFSDR